jgi:acyl dehydratase
MVKALGLAPSLEEDSIRGLEALVGQEIRLEPYNNEATRDTIRHYALGIGDDNPLWCDPDYAKSAAYGGLIAPPTFLYSVFDGAIGAGLPGVQPIYAGTEWQFGRPVRRGEEIVPSAVFGAVKRLSGRTASDMLLQSTDVTYRVGDEVVATARATTFRVPRSDADGGLNYEPRDEYQYSDEEIERIRADVKAEYRRGSEKLDVAALKVGEVIRPVVKGPIDRITMTAYYAGCIGSPGYKACEVAWKYRDWAINTPELLPSNYDPSYFAETVLPSLGHQDTDVAREIGMPNAYDNGPQRCGWFAHAVTNWMGDESRLERLTIRLRRPDLFGDTVWIGGQVVGTELTEEFGYADVELTARNQMSELVATGTARVRAAR